MMEDATQPRHSHLFTVRIWLEAAGHAPLAWRGKVQHVPGGAWRYFHDWGSLAVFLQSQLEELETTNHFQQ
jgi:hypothetical protein